MRTLRLISVILFALALLPLSAASSVAAPAPAPAAATSGSYWLDAYNATNAERAKRGLAKLRTSKCLATFARAHAKRMGEARRIYHQDLGPIMRKCNLRTAGENVAVGFPTGKAVVDGWMDSWGHRKNILSKSFRYMSISAYKAGGKYYVVQLFAST
ncbi:uncharacterized protein YkwD [Nocardioides daedukensis]|uniref:Uncharacterized protein YkwD n=1 Tax=Nocardioides daedukensis TaxID=634462 RepID=A0A7Y9RXC8_9ACTN|nr:CAP domain-containing protein [Nocardioides daedukensis]NYG58402.1 uncharacterized protein YkwD [Nocardioides daedukensis]